MSLKRSIWIIFYALIGFGVVYFAWSGYLRWQDIRQQAEQELRYLNHIFSSSVNLNFKQQEIMLQLIGEQLLFNPDLQSPRQAAHYLDRIQKLHPSLNGLGLISPDGDLLKATSNIDIERMPNLKSFPQTRDTFLQALEETRLVIGHTYYMDAFQEWVIPLRKAIRNEDGEVIGVMAAGIRPSQLLPRVQISTRERPFSMILIHDDSFRYAYISGLSDQALQTVIPNPIPQSQIDSTRRYLARSGISIDDLRRNPRLSTEFMIDSTLRPSLTNLVSLSYIPEYRLWSMATLPVDALYPTWHRSLLVYGLTLLLVGLVLFLLFRIIDRAQKRHQNLLLQQANRDFLTGLHNRQYLNRIESRWAGPGKRPFSVWFIDLDNFKHINDSHGHRIGDRLLRQAADRIVRRFDPKDLVCRQGGDEFIVLSHLVDANAVRERARQLLRDLLQPLEIDDYAFRIGASIGICFHPEDGENFDSLFSAADSAMYEAKKKKNSYHLYTDTLRQQVRESAHIEQALRSAVTNGEIDMAYQLQVEPDGRPCGVEALCRWNSPELGTIAPDQFIPIAERNGSIIPLGHFIIDRSLADIAALAHKRGRDDLRLSINISVRQLQEKRFSEQLLAALDRHGFSTERLTLEITESLFMEDYDYLMPVIDGLRNQGIRIALDDFGTGYSSLSLLRRLPIDELKIDKSFIDTVCSNRQDHQLVMSILEIARTLGMRVVAEGIESSDQAELLREHGCDCMQGYFFSPPLPIEELERLCHNWSRVP